MKWDAFIGRKGGMKNILAPLKNSNDTSSPSSYTELSRPPKLDAIPQGKREEVPQNDDRPQSPAPGQHRERIVDSPRQSPALNQEQEQEVVDRPQSSTSEKKVDERPQSPTPDQQQQRKVDDQQHIQEEENKSKDLLKDKPIIFISGGPGMIIND